MHYSTCFAELRQSWTNTENYLGIRAGGETSILDLAYFGTILFENRRRISLLGFTHEVKQHFFSVQGVDVPTE